jgi:hypothetical protein
MGILQRFGRGFRTSLPIALQSQGAIAAKLIIAVEIAFFVGAIASCYLQFY